MMRLRIGHMGAVLVAVAAGVGPAGARGQSVQEYLRSLKSEPPTLTDAARRIDHIQRCLSDNGSVVVKQPDVWSQARMTKFRKEYENLMVQRLTVFQPSLAAQIARSDFASFSSQTALAASISPLAPGTSLQLNSPAQVADELKTAQGMLGSSSPLPLLPTSTPPAAAQDFSLLNTQIPTVPSGSTKAGTPAALSFGLEPNVVSDEQGDYITHLQRLRRINLGDDNADSAGYGLYLMRVPVSITPGDCTKKGFGAVVNMTVSHDFGPKFLATTYRNLVINDLVDQLAPVVYEMIRSGLADEFHRSMDWYYNPRTAPRSASTAPGSAMRMADKVVQGPPPMKPGAPSLHDRSLPAIAAIAGARALNRNDPRVYPVAPDDVNRVFGGTTNLLILSAGAQRAVDLKFRRADSTPVDPHVFNKVHLTDVRSYLKQELGAAYDLMDGHFAMGSQPVLADVPYVEELIDKVFNRKFEGPQEARANTLEEFGEFGPMYQGLTQRLPGNLFERPIGVLCWAIAVDAGLLNRQLREDMAETKGPDGWACPPDAEAMAFYQPSPPQEVAATFEQYVRARWPIITFALEPVVDQQNIDDAFTRRRDLQLAVSFALAAGRISFRQAMTFTRQLQYESQTVALNQTVAAFAHGNDTFGWRISPRYQTPPEESNLGTMTNILLRGGPGPNYQLAHSKIEPGLREMTAVVVMPSFIRGARVDVATDWFRLSDPDELKVHTAHTVELGQKINEARDCLEMACQCGRYRPEDVQRLRARLHQLEQLLPLQTQFVKVPFENTLGGFDLFTPGASALVPQLTGAYGVDYIDLTKGCDLIVYGKHFSIYETHVNVGGRELPAEGTGAVTAKDAGGNAVSVVSTVTPLLDASGNLLLVKSDGSTVALTDNGSFDIISREVMRLRIPRALASQLNTVTRGDGSTWVEISVSTPNGVSNRLQVPVAPAAPAAPAAAAAPGYTITAGAAVTLTYHVTDPDPMNPKGAVDKVSGSSPDKVSIAPTTPAPVDPDWVAIKVEFDNSAGLAPPPLMLPPVELDPDKRLYSIKTADLAAQLLDAAKTYYGIFGVTPPPIKSAKITITAAVPPTKGHESDPATPATPQADLVILPGTTDTQLTITLKFATGPVPPATGNPAQTKGAFRPRGPSRTAAGLPPLPEPVSRDAQARRTSFQQPAAPAPTVPATAGLPGIPGVTGLPGIPGVSGVPGLLRVPDLTNPSDVAALQRAASLLPRANSLINSVATPGSNAPAVVVLPSRAPTVNVQVPVTNLMNPAKARPHFSLFHRRQDVTPQNPTRPPLMERMFGNP